MIYPDQPIRLCVAMPVQDSIPGECIGHHAATFIEAQMLCSSRGDGSQLSLLTPLDLAPHDMARHFCAEKALDNECTHLFFMDDDTITPRGGLTKLFQTMYERFVPVVSGLYLRRGYPYTSVWSFERPSEHGREKEFYNVEADAGVHEIHVSGLGCALIDLRWMCKNVEKPWFKQKQGENYTIVSDDVVMYEKIRAAGGTILGDADVQCTHVGRREFITRGAANDLRNVFRAHEKSGKFSGKVMDSSGSPSTKKFLSKDEMIEKVGDRSLVVAESEAVLP